MKALHLFCGIGVGAAGFVDEGFEVCGAVDNDAGACRDFELVTGSPATCADLDTMTPAELADACNGAPDVVFTSPPCKGMSGCLSEAKAATPMYQQMNALTLRGVWLALEAFPHQLPKLLILENVPKILSRGAAWLERIEAMLRGYGYAVTRSIHDCGELGGLAQHRRRFMLVARHVATCPPFLRVPATQRVRGIGEVLGELPVPIPGGTEGGSMHRLPKLAAINWVRLALIPAGKDWRALKDIERVELHHRAGRQNGQYGIEGWHDSAHAVLGHSSARDTFGSVADPRLQCNRRDGGHGVKAWDDPSSPIIGNASIDNFPAQIADPRLRCGSDNTHAGTLGLQDWEEPSHTIQGSQRVQNSWASVVDPRLAEISARHAGTMGVQDAEQPGHTVTGGHGRRDWDSYADPRVKDQNRGNYGVQGWAEPSHVVRGAHVPRTAPASVADPRVPVIEGPAVDLASKRPIHMVIRAEDGTWHRPMTTLELAALQSMKVRNDDGTWLELSGNDAERREHIGNAVPRKAAAAIARSCRETLSAGKGWTLVGDGTIWVRNESLAASEAQ